MPAAAATWSRVPGCDAQLAGTRFRDVRWFGSIDSTNRYLLAEAARPAGAPEKPAGAPEGTVAVAAEQTAGRGRHGRTWTTTPGAALLVSVLLRPHLPPERLHLVTLAAAVAATDAVQAVGGFEARVKWPNDLVVGDHKLAGVLAEADGAGAVVVGMGCNLRADAFPPDLADIATACDLHSAGPVEREPLLVAWLQALDRELDALDTIIAAATQRSATLGRQVRVELAREQFTGTAEALTPEGYLTVRTPGGDLRTVSAGDVIHLRPT
jgi:BirA family transcriptional regulator, biotin operon repressor / biotin---[acetyl-CoA-carboxylase] ligase